MQTSIKPGQVWRDTNGRRIQAHGFSVFHKDGLYYWYGENKEHTKPLRKVWHWGVRCYVSADLYNWEDKGLIIPPQPDDLSSPLHPTYCMDRPHILFCEKTGKYVAWLKIMCGPTSQFMSVMQADNFFGPYSFVRKIYKPLQMDTGDFTLVRNETNGRAYFIFDRPHFEIVAATLSDDYTEVTGEFSEHYAGLIPPFSREAPAYLTRNGKHYLFTSGTSGYFPNASQTCVFDDFHGNWTDLGDPCIGDSDNNTFRSQITCVLKVPGKDLYIACADRWKPGRFNGWVSRWMVGMMEKAMKQERNRKRMAADTSPKTEAALPEKETLRLENTSKADYVWLPIEWDGNRPIIRWRDEWKVES